jgi:hypothetical protein
MSVIIDKPHYKLTVDKNPVFNPPELKELVFKKTSYNEDGSILTYSKFELYLTEDEIKMIKAAL